MLVLAAAMAAAGCGGGGDNTNVSTANTPEVRGNSYANTVCSIAVAWETASTQIDGYLASTASGDDVLNAVNQAQNPTNLFITNIRGLPQPDDAGQKAAYTSLQSTADSLYKRSQTIQSDVEALDTGAKDAQAQITLLYGDLQTSVEQLDTIYPESDVAATVDSHENCEQLGV